MTRAVALLRALVGEAVSLVADDWVLPLGIGGVLLLAWFGVSHGGAAGAAFGAAGAIALWVAGATVTAGRQGRPGIAPRPGGGLTADDLDSNCGGRVSDRDRRDPQAARPAPR